LLAALTMASTLSVVISAINTDILLDTVSINLLLIYDTILSI
jgi:hypothetical protein